MDYAKQVNETLNAYTRTQQRLWEDWLSVMQGFQGKAAQSPAWEQPMQKWAEQVQRIMESQTQHWLDVQSAWVQQGLNGFDMWNGTVQQAVDAWEASLDRLMEAQGALLQTESKRPAAAKKAAGAKKAEEGKSSEEKAA